METQIVHVLRALLGLMIGGGVGWAFGRLQAAALRRHEQNQQDGKLKNGWTLMPGSGARVAGLLLALVFVQALCPLLFADGTQWWVSAGVALTYGGHLLWQLRRRLKASTN